MKKIIVLMMVTAFVLAMTVPAAAAPAGFTGWSIDAGAPRYYENGVLKTNAWVKYGNFYYYVGADGYTVANRVLSAAALNEIPVEFTDTNSTAVRYETGSMTANPQVMNIIAAQAAQAAAQQAAADAARIAAATINTGATADQVRRGERKPYEITNDFEAFKYIHPEIVSVYGSDLQGLYGKYLSTYGGDMTGGVYLATIARLYEINGNTPHYNQSYEDLHNGTHKAYTGSGQWIIESCNDSSHNSEGYRKCSKCGHVFKHESLKDLQK